MRTLDRVVAWFYTLRRRRALARYEREGLTPDEMRIMLALDFPPPMGSVPLSDLPDPAAAPIRSFPPASRFGQGEEVALTFALAGLTCVCILLAAGRNGFGATAWVRTTIVLTAATSLAARASHIQRAGVYSRGGPLLWGWVGVPILVLLLAPFAKVPSVNSPVGWSFVLGILHGLGYFLLRQTWVRQARSE